MIVVFSDLDGTLLDRQTYSFEGALPAVEKLRELNAPLVLVTSKTFDEVLFWRKQIDNHSPFVIENGAAVFAPRGNLQFPPRAAARSHKGYDRVEFGVRYRELVQSLKSAARESGCLVRGFSDMDVHEVADACDLPIQQATMAKARLYDEPFRLIEGSPEALARAIERRGLRLTRGGRFHHITGHNDKAAAVSLLIETWKNSSPLKTIGIGDAPNDAGFLNAVDYPVLMESPEIDEMKRLVPRARLAVAGPHSWSRAIFEILATG
jgi:mannosyl-3-phosphoglycerate phosphatase